jgi:branched-subunit amino acid transport protein
MTSTDSFWLATIGIGLTGVLTRSSFLLFGAKLSLPPALEGALRHAPASALAAIIAPTLFVDPSVDGFTPWNPRVAAAAVAILVAWRTRGMLGSMAAGATVYAALRLWAAS